MNHVTKFKKKSQRKLNVKIQVDEMQIIVTYYK
jgi:hypothetical protein